ncbi:hypothetical protein [Tropicimonas sediminicola]|uniref:Uncharacterized protein n=1 Tax=Tropicimonas sediminicola TaxID=1031541 RepID=A0A239L748_9RHOB|nr:hypothetical protein [Tropicimonas sediminicola]SNT26271.1 hypothetical protein SAMN05421757_10911 [Tropicimonas sediminicola]
MATSLFVPRPEEAARIADLLTPDPLFGEIAGLFLAAPRRTGKSTFLRRDLMPLLQEQGRIVLYVDLWADREVDPGKLIVTCIARALEESDGPIAKLRRNVPFSGVGALGFRVELKSAGTWEGTIPDALLLLVKATGKDVVMIVDEAQHSLISETGKNAMFALKAARDAVNQSDLEGKLYLVMTGSHRDKLAALVHDHQAPFFGASVRDFPPLGREYTAALTGHLNARLADNAKLDPDLVEAAFDRLGRRPERLNACLREMILGTEFGEAALNKLVDASIDAAREQLLSEISTLSDLQQALLRRMAEDGIEFAPFTEATRKRLGAQGKAPSKGAVQKALNALRDKGLVWRPGFGRYVLESAEVAQALRG